ncbi:hypothetical protein Pen01_09560 [Phytomonospora endophytica]|nr:hypothetical protein Pen01_09560 [Phytomonospora endophytica]
MIAVAMPESHSPTLRAPENPADRADPPRDGSLAALTGPLMKAAPAKESKRTLDPKIAAIST